MILVAVIRVFQKYGLIRTTSWKKVCVMHIDSRKKKIQEVLLYLFCSSGTISFFQENPSQDVLLNFRVRTDSDSSSGLVILFLYHISCPGNCCYTNFNHLRFQSGAAKSVFPENQ